MRNLLHNLLSDPVIVPATPQVVPAVEPTEIPPVPENTGSEILTDQTLEVMATAPVSDASVEVKDEVLQLESYLTGLVDYQQRCVGISEHLGQAVKVSKQVQAGLEAATLSLTEYYGVKKPKISKEGFMETAKEVGGKIRQVILELIKKIQEAFKAFFSKENFLLKKIEELLQKCKAQGQESSESGDMYYPFLLSEDGAALDGNQLSEKTMTLLESSIKILEALLKDCEEVTSEAIFKEIDGQPDKESLIRLLTSVADIYKDPLNRPELDWKTSGSGEEFPDQTYVDLKLGGMRAFIPNYPTESSEEIAEALIRDGAAKPKVPHLNPNASRGNKNKVVDFKGACLFTRDLVGKNLTVKREDYKIEDIRALLEQLKSFLTSTPYRSIEKLADETFHRAYLNYAHFSERRKEDNNGAAIDKCYLVARMIILRPSLQLLNCMELIENAMIALSGSYLLSTAN